MNIVLTIANPTPALFALLAQAGALEPAATPAADTATLAAEGAAAALDIATPPKRGPGRPPKPKPVAVEMKPVAVETKPVAVETKPEAPVEPETPKPAPAKAIDIRALQGLVTRTLDMVGPTSLRKVFAEFGAPKLTDLKPDQYPAFAAKLNELLALAGA